MQHPINCFSTACDKIWAYNKYQETEILHQPAPQKAYVALIFTVKEENFEPLANSRNFAAHSPALQTSTQRSIHKLPKPAQLSDGFANQSGKGVVFC